MASKKKNTLKKKKSSTSKTSSKKKNTSIKTSTKKTKNNSIKKTSTKATNIKNNNKSNVKKTSVAKKEDKKQEEKVTTFDLPKLKEEEKIDKVVEQETYVNNKLTELEDQQALKNANKKDDLKKITKKSSKKKKSNAKKIASKKKSSFKKKLDKLLRKIKIYGLKSVIPTKLIIGSIITTILVTTLIIVVSISFHKERIIDLQLIPSKIDQLKTVSFDISESNNIITSVTEENKAYDSVKSLKEYYEYDFENVFKLNKEYVDEYVIRYNEKNNQLFIVIKATTGNHDRIEETMNNFMKEKGIKNYEYLTYQNYQIYINSNNNAIVRSKIMQSQIRVFNILQELRKDDIEDNFDIKDSYYEEALFKTSMIKNNDTCEYIIIKPKNKNNKERIKELMNEHYNSLEDKWLNKNSENYELVKNRLEKEYNGYLIYIVSHNNDLVFELIKG